MTLPHPCVKLCLFAGILQLATVALSIETPIVQTPNGKVAGTFKKTNDGRTFMQFHGIPFAQPPIGELRFAPPKPAEPWTGTWVANATYICLQVDMVDESQDGETKGTEDCLYMNVYVPGNKIDPEKNYDVIVHIHGGGFVFGSSTFYSYPKYFMDKNVVFVTFNYRLGIFGFLSAEDKYLPGNFGMKDQVMALKWIQKHIKSFGGNPDSVTITGLSAGGASVHYHLLSPMSKGLFHKAISASGSALEPWALHEAPLAKAKQVGELVGCHYANTKDFLSCLRRRPAQQIVETIKTFRTWMFSPICTFALVVDSHADEPFLPEHPYKLLNDGKVHDVPWIASLTKDEGVFPSSQLLKREEYLVQLRNNWDEYISWILHYELTIPANQLHKVGQQIKKLYLGDREVSIDTFPEIVKLTTDRLFGITFEQAARMHAKAIKSPVYFYQYGYMAEEIDSLSQIVFGFKEKLGVCHGDDTIMIFGTDIEGSERDVKIKDFLVDMWIKFAKTGEPDVKEWKSVSKNPNDLLNYLFIGSPEHIEPRTTNDLSNTNKDFWFSLPFAENANLLKTNLKTEL